MAIAAHCKALTMTVVSHSNNTIQSIIESSPQCPHCATGRATQSPSIVRYHYRGLTRLSSIDRIYEKCINPRFVKWTKDKRIINDVEGIEHCSSLSMVWVVN